MHELEEVDPTLLHTDINDPIGSNTEKSELDDPNDRTLNDITEFLENAASATSMAISKFGNTDVCI